VVRASANFYASTLLGSDLKEHAEAFDQEKKPVVTWIVLANSRVATVLENHGPRMGLIAPVGKSWHA